MERKKIWEKKKQFLKTFNDENVSKMKKKTNRKKTQEQNNFCDKIKFLTKKEKLDKNVLWHKTINWKNIKKTFL